MFSERDIADYCRQCQGNCASQYRCPLKMDHPPARTRGIVPFMPGRFRFMHSTFSDKTARGCSHSTERLIAGLHRLNSTFFRVL